MNNLFNLADVLQLEQDVLNKINENNDTISKNNYFKEIVAQFLYEEWLLNKNNTNILVYSFPLIHSIMVKYINHFHGLTKEDVFQDLCIIVLNHLPKYKKENGRLFTYLTFIISCKLKDILTKNTKNGLLYYQLEEDWDTEVNIQPILDLFDFKLFLDNTKIEYAGQTLTKIINSILMILDDNSALNISDRKMLIYHIAKLTKLPDILIEKSLDMLIIRYNNSILD